MVGVIIVAAGSGVRLGAELPKALVPLGGKPLVLWAVERCLDAGLEPPVVVHPAGAGAAFATALDGVPVAALVAGGLTRSDSVRHGLDALDARVDVVAVHDAARPLMPAAVIRHVVAAVQGEVLAAAPGLAIADTVKRQIDGRIIGTVERDELVGIQTPQVFVRAALAAVVASGVSATDELALVEAAVDDGTLSGEIRVVPGSVFGHKITTSDDLALLDTLAATQPGYSP